MRLASGSLLGSPLSNGIKCSTLLRLGAAGYVVGFLSWLFFISHFAPLLIGYRIQFPTAYSRVLPIIVYSLLSISYFLSSFSCLGLMLKNNSMVAMLCFVSYVAAGSAWIYSIFKQSSWPILGYTSMIAAQLVWGITLLRNKKHFPSPQVYEIIGICFILSAIFCVIYWPIVGYFGFLSWLVGMGWFYAFSSATTAILLVRLQKQP